MTRSEPAAPRARGQHIRPIFLVLVAASVLVPLGLFALAAHRDWQNNQEAALARIAHVRDLFLAHTARVFQTQRLIARAVGDRLENMRPEEIAQSRAVQELLHDLQAGSPEVEAIEVIDSAGTVRSSSRSFPPPAESHPGLIEEVRRGNGLAVGGRRAGPGGGGVFDVAIARTSPDGAVTSAVVTTVSAAYFDRLYQPVASPTSALTLVRTDGAILVRIPGRTTDPIWKVPPTAALMEAINAAPGGALTTVSPIDGLERMIAFARVEGFPVAVAYGVGTEEIVQQWRAGVLNQVLYFLPATLILLALAVITARSQRQLAALNTGLEARIAERTHDLSQALADKDALLQEVYHRVKNNMQIISSLVGMQIRTGGSPEETNRRIHAMALVHELVYGSGELEGLELSKYIGRLCEALREYAPPGVTFAFDMEPVRISLDRAVPVALILNEVLMNALRHAYPAGETGTVRIALHARGGDAVVEVADRGRGLDGAEPASGFGLRLLGGLAMQVQGTYEFVEDGGTTFRLVFPTRRPAPPSHGAAAA